MVRCLLILMIMTAPSFAQDLGNLNTFGGMNSPQNSFQSYGNWPPLYGKYSQNFGNNPNVFESYRPQVSDYLIQDPRSFNHPYNNLTQDQNSTFPLRRYNKFNQFDPTIPPY